MAGYLDSVPRPVEHLVSRIIVESKKAAQDLASAEDRAERAESELAALRERTIEECAKVCENTTALWPIYNKQREEMAKELAAAIRALAKNQTREVTPHEHDVLQKALRAEIKS